MESDLMKLHTELSPVWIASPALLTCGGASGPGCLIQELYPRLSSRRGWDSLMRVQEQDVVYEALTAEILALSYR